MAWRKNRTVTEEQLAKILSDSALLNRFWSMVEKQDVGCWNWKGKLSNKGYGNFHVDSNSWRAHRFSWFIHNKATIPSVTFVCHKCDNRKCVNPEHLFLGSSADNAADCARKDRSSLTKLRGDQVNAIRAAFDRGAPVSDIAKEFGVSWGTASGIGMRRYRPHTPEADGTPPASSACLRSQLRGLRKIISELQSEIDFLKAKKAGVI